MKQTTGFYVLNAAFPSRRLADTSETLRYEDFHRRFCLEFWSKNYFIVDPDREQMKELCDIYINFSIKKGFMYNCGTKQIPLYRYRQGAEVVKFDHTIYNALNTKK